MCQALLDARLKKGTRFLFWGHNQQISVAKKSNAAVFVTIISWSKKRGGEEDMLQKRDDKNTIQEVIERNTGLSMDVFLHPEESPYIHHLKEASEYIREHKNEVFTIVADYDVDGICAASILYWGLKRFGIETRTRIPRRFSEGYGLSEKIIDEIEEGIVITVDNGIASMPAIKKAKEKGLTVIVTDHHLAPMDGENRILPPADILVDPNAEDETIYKNYCGAAITYRLVQELLPEHDLSDLLVLASIATVADVMTLQGANRLLVIKGLRAINDGKGVPGLRALLDEIHLTEHITEDDYGFKLGPIFNASGRLHDAGGDLVLDVLNAEKATPEVMQKINRLILNNEERKQCVQNLMPVADKLAKGERPIVIYHPKFGEGIIGILAGHLSEKYQCPVVVFTKTEKGVLKGSGRSIPEVHLKHVLDQISDTMLGYGGHAGAAGLVVKNGDLKKFKKAFCKACGKLPEIKDESVYDLELAPQNFQRYLTQLELFAPYGEGNPKPVFRIWYSGAGEYSRIGDGSHFRIRGKNLTLMGFGLTKKYEDCGMPTNIDCIGYPKKNYLNGNVYPQFEMIGFEERASQC